MKHLLKNTTERDLVTAKIDDFLETSYDKLKHNKIRHLPVIDDCGDISGIISDRDFQRAMVGTKYNEFQPGKNRFPEGSKVGSFMSWPVKSVSRDASLIDVINIMIDNKVSSVLVTDHDCLTGIITHEDLLKVLSQVLTKQEKSLVNRVEQFAYNSPIGQVIDMVGNAGL